MFPNYTFGGGKVCAMDRVKMVAGQTARGRTWLALGYAVFAVLLGAMTNQLNQRVVRRHLEPQRDELTALLTQLDS